MTFGGFWRRKREKELVDMGKKYLEINPAKALIYFDKALKLNPSSGYAWYLKGIAYKKLRKHKKACECFRKAHELGFAKAEDEIQKDIEKIASKIEELENKIKFLNVDPIAISKFEAKLSSIKNLFRTRNYDQTLIEIDKLQKEIDKLQIDIKKAKNGLIEVENKIKSLTVSSELISRFHSKLKRICLTEENTKNAYQKSINSGKKLITQ